MGRFAYIHKQILDVDKIYKLQVLMQVLFAFQFDAELHFPQYTYELKGTRIQI